MTPTHLPTELVPCTCNHQGVQAVPVTAALGRLGAPASMDWHFSDQAECARAAPPPGGTSRAVPPAEHTALGQGRPTLLPESPAQFQQLVSVP